MNAAELPDEVKRDTIFVPSIPVSQMFVPYRDQPGGYARPTNTRRVQKLVDEFEPQAVGVLLVSMREPVEGSVEYAVIDGSHRLEAAIQHGMETLDCYVYIDLTVEEEARLYRKFGDYLKQTARDRYVAAQTEGEPETLAIDRILAEFGLKVSRVDGPDSGIRGVSSLVRVAKEQGPHILRDSLDLIHAVFGTKEQAFGSTALQGTALFLERFGKTYDRKRMIEAMGKAGLLGIRQKADAVKASADKALSSQHAWGRALMALHNFGLPETSKKRLGPWPDRLFNEASRAAVTKNLAEKAVPASIQQRRIAASERAMSLQEGATCPRCRAKTGARCKTQQGAPMAQVHPERLVAARAERAKRKNGKA